MKVYLQDSFTAEETVQTKLRFEKESATEGVYIKAYNTDNGVFTAEQFMKEVLTTSKVPGGQELEDTTIMELQKRP